MTLKKTVEYVDANDLKKTLPRFGARHTQTLLLFTFLVIAYGMRTNLSVGIVAMTDPKANPNHDIPTYEWNNTSTILSSFFWGYVVLQLPAGPLVKKFGPKWFLVVAMSVPSLFGILIPPAASLGSWAVIACRVIQGLAQGVIYPTLHHLISRWIPACERSTLGTFIYTGGSFATMLSMPFTGWVSSTSAGWPTAFYVYGGAGLAWTAIWIWLGKGSPSQHKTISPNEKLFIETASGDFIDEENKSTPWRKILTSIPLWTILVSYCCQDWGFFTLLTEIPTYLNGVLAYDIQSNGLLSACPYLACCIFAFGFGPFVDFIINRKYLSRTVARKIATSIGFYVPALFLLLLGLLVNGKEDKGIAIAFLIVSVGANAAQLAGIVINHIDISPNHAGTLMAITNFFSTITSILAPLFVELIVTDQSNAAQWNVVFFISSGVYIVGGTLFNALASAEVQKWDSM